MKTFARASKVPVPKRALCAFLGIASWGIAQSRAGQYTWTGDSLASTNWSETVLGTNWAGNNIPASNASTQLTFSSAMYNYSLTPVQNIASPFLLNSIAFGGQSFDLQGNSLQFESSTAGPSIIQNASTSQTIQENLILDAPLTLSGSGAGTLTLDNSISQTAAANQSLTMSTTGAVVLPVSNSFAGGVLMNSGQLQIGNGYSLGTGPLSFSGGELNATANISVGNNLTANGFALFTLSAAAGQTLSLGGNAPTFNQGTQLTIGSPGNSGTVLFNYPSFNFGTLLGSEYLSVAYGTLKDGSDHTLLQLMQEYPTTIAAGAQIDLSGPSTISFANNLSIAGSGTLLVGDSTISISGGNQSISASIVGTTGSATSSIVAKGASSTLTLSGPASTLHNLEIDSGTVTLNGGSLKLTSNTALPGTAMLGDFGPGGEALYCNSVLNIQGGAVLDTSAVTDGGADIEETTVSGTGSKWILPLETDVDGSLSVSNGASVTRAAGDQFSTVLIGYVHIGALQVNSGGNFSPVSVIVGGGILASGYGYGTISGANSTLNTTSVDIAGTAFNNDQEDADFSNLTVSNGATATVSGTTNIWNYAATLGVDAASFTTGGLDSVSGANLYLSDPAGGVAMTEGSDNLNDTFAGNIQDYEIGVPGSITKVGSGMFTLTGEVSNTGTIACNDGTIEFSADAVHRGTGALNAAVGATIQYDDAVVYGGLLTGSGAQIIGSGGGHFIGSTIDVGTTLNVDAVGTFGTVTNNGSVILATGQTLTWAGGSNGSTGTVMVPSASTIDLGGQQLQLSGLLINNGGNNASGNGVRNGSVAVGTAGLATGTGFYSSITTQNGGAYLAGNGPGLGQVGTFAINAGGELQVDINDANGIAGPQPPTTTRGFSLAQVLSELDITATASGKFNIALISVAAPSGQTPGPIDNFNPAQSYEWPVIEIESGAVTNGTFTANAFNVDTSGFENAYTGTFGVTMLGDQIDVIYTPAAVPEPCTGIAFAGVGAWLVRRRRAANRYGDGTARENRGDL